ncbi:phosphatidylinositol-specific phospholipase C1-like protein [Chitinophaga rhizophila]|uniref:Phosphatidylinositol-specific phospholipase C1-like protein n=1 Tax=Chitinophaga rhizophila TaxID=2866212 RepID=A0ABS7GC39_9BACT|nr:phosphatidylinositol-specific phospholipase C1-like protein [Chitinophaga rhizophila]MBW8685240.1 phosphatidylinositol-specific phospholipase C1-like protein [Chitinophaga rhizophila]
MKIISGIVLGLAICLLKDEIPDNIKMNRIQVIGSHNSYKRAIDPALFRLFQQRDSVSASKLDYEHISLTEQLDMGLRNLEIDVYADEKGGRFAHPKGLEWAKGQPPFDEKGWMNEPGFKVLHIPDLDFRNDNLTLKNTLAELRAWSEKHPDHAPVFITLEPKDGASRNPEMTVPEPFTANTFEELDKALIAGLGKSRIITPDMVRGKYKTLEEAVLQDNWPSLKAARGKFVFLLDDKDTKRDLYIAGHPSLKGRIMFANADPGTPEAAMLFRNNPTMPEITTLVAKGYIVRTRADADTREARLNDRSSFEAACTSGAQIITTDYYRKSTHFQSDYEISFDGQKYVRLNPVNSKTVTMGKN